MTLLPAELYEAFAEFRQPEHSTSHTHCAECAEHDETLQGVPRERLSIEQIGTVCWGPVPFLTADAMAYFLPRLMELALQGVKNKDGGPFFEQFLLQIGTHAPSEPCFARLGQKQRDLVYRCIEQIGSQYAAEIEAECCEDRLAQALGNWGP
jgi:hypothetical protein